MSCLAVLQSYMLPFDPEYHADWHPLEPSQLDAAVLHEEALRLFPDAFFSAVSSETYREWVGEDPSQVKVGGTGGWGPWV